MESPVAARDPVEAVCSLYRSHRDEIEGRGWSLADIYVELGGGGPRSSPTHARFAEFFNGQTRTALSDAESRSKLDFWAGIPEPGATLRDEALKTAVQNVGMVECAPIEAVEERTTGMLDSRTRSLILAHNQIDAELYAHFAGLAERDRSPDSELPGEPGRGRGAVCVLGMSRSGTSVTARILNVLGLDLGDEGHLMQPAADNNPAGFWEHRGIVDLNEDILATLGDAPRQRWRHPPDLPDGWERDPRLDGHRHVARSILRSDFAGVAFWGWKDPRTCLTLPFWRHVLADVPEVESSLRYVICVRHPLEIAASLMARDGMDRDEALRLWLRYMSAALEETAGRPRTFVAYESYFPGWERQASRLADFLGRPPPSDAQRARIAIYLDERLRHHDQAAAGADAELPPDVADLYGQLTGLCGT